MKNYFHYIFRRVFYISFLLIGSFLLDSCKCQKCENCSKAINDFQRKINASNKEQSYIIQELYQTILANDYHYTIGIETLYENHNDKMYTVKLYFSHNCQNIVSFAKNNDIIIVAKIKGDSNYFRLFQE